MALVTDIVIATKDRAGLLRKTIRYIRQRTTSPYRLTVIDDGSQDDEALRLLSGLERVVRKDISGGIASNLRMLRSMGLSDPLIFTDDDVLCPRLTPDWLSRLSSEMAARPSLGVLALNNPQDFPEDTRRKVSSDGEVSLCLNVGATFAMIRSATLEAVNVQDGMQSPVKQFCRMAVAQGFGVGYLTRCYCQHIGSASVRRGVDIKRELRRVAPIDGDTLEPREEYRG